MRRNRGGLPLRQLARTPISSPKGPKSPVSRRFGASTKARRVTVPGSVPAKVPAHKRAGRVRAGGAQPPRYLTGDPSGWRFQFRLSPQFCKNAPAGGSRLAGAAPMVRAQLGPRSRREANRLAGHLATLCQTVCVFAVDIWKGMAMDPSQIDDRQRELVELTVAACQNAINRALENPA